MYYVAFTGGAWSEDYDIHVHMYKKAAPSCKPSPTPFTQVLAKSLLEAYTSEYGTSPIELTLFKFKRHLMQRNAE